MKRDLPFSPLFDLQSLRFIFEAADHFDHTDNQTYLEAQPCVLRSIIHCLDSGPRAQVSDP